MQAQIIKGKALFYAYKRKIHTIIANRNLTKLTEGNKILKECFENMKESISLLGEGLDKKFLDEEASKVLDWVMMECLSATNKLHECMRCLLCRTKQRKLQNSHIIPHFILRDKSVPEQSYFFGHHRQLRTSGKLTYPMLCERCERHLSLNGEEDFSKLFPESGVIQNSKWLFSFCAGVVFRTLGTIVQYPMHANDDEVYKVLLQCRRHLLEVLVKPLNDIDMFQLELTHNQTEPLKMYLFKSPTTAQIQFQHEYEELYPSAFYELSRNNLLDSYRRIFNGRVHFFLLCCGPITIVVNFDSSAKSHERNGFLLSPEDNCANYRIGNKKECIRLLPQGVRSVLGESPTEDWNKMLRFTSETLKPPVARNIVPNKVEAHFVVSSNKYSNCTILPKGLEVFCPYNMVAWNECVVLPQGNQVILHGHYPRPELKMEATFLLCFGNLPGTKLDAFYVLYIVQDSSAKHFGSDCLSAEIKDNKIVLTDFIVKNIYAKRNIEQMQGILDKTVLAKHIKNLNIVTQLVRLRRYAIQNLLSILIFSTPVIFLF